METITVAKGEFILSTEKAKMDLPIIHHYLANQSYWAQNIPIETVQLAIENSLNFGIFHNNKQIGYARIVSDFATVAYLGDVFILPTYRGLGLSKWMIENIMLHPNLQGLRRWILLTADAHDLYKKFGWSCIAIPERWMDKHNPNVYQ
ncbi:MAG: GNAT family N-acetyltransferase, partial [Bacteroidota bacterium]